MQLCNSDLNLIFWDCYSGYILAGRNTYIGLNTFSHCSAVLRTLIFLSIGGFFFFAPIVKSNILKCLC